MSDIEATEEFREEVEVGNWHDSVCRSCGKAIHLAWNGGELDHKVCCGYEYALEHGQVFFVVYKLVKPNAR